MHDTRGKTVTRDTQPTHSTHETYDARNLHTHTQRTHSACTTHEARNSHNTYAAHVTKGKKYGIEPGDKGQLNTRRT